MKRGCAILGLLFGLCVAAYPIQPPFPLNERLDYHISWNGILVAWSVSTTGTVQQDGKDYLFIRVETQTYPVFNVFYKVNDLHECLLDTETLLPVRFEKTMREGLSHYHDITTFDYAAGTARFENLEAGTVTNVAINADTRDYLSFMYFMRGRSLRPETTETYSVLADDQVYQVTVHAKKVEKIGLANYPDVPSVRVEPEAAFNGLFVRTGKATLWVSQDMRRIITRLYARVPFGRITARLMDVSGDGDDFWIKEKKGGDEDKN